MISKKIRDITLINTRDESFFRSYKAIAKTLGHDASILLAVLMEVDNMMDYNDGWFFQTIETLEKFSLLSRHKQEKALDKLTKAGIVLQENKGMPCKRYFKIDYETLNKSLFANNSQTSMRKIDKQVCEKLATSKEITDKDINKENNNICPNTEIEDVVKEKIPYKEIQDMFNEILGNELPPVLKMTQARRDLIRTVYNHLDKDLENIRTLFNGVNQNDYIMGRNNGWKSCTFDWLMTIKQATKYYELGKRGEVKSGATERTIYDDGSGDKEDDRPSPADILRRAIEEAERESEERNE